MKLYNNIIGNDSYGQIHVQDRVNTSGVMDSLMVRTLTSEYSKRVD